MSTRKFQKYNKVSKAPIGPEISRTQSQSPMEERKVKADEVWVEIIRLPQPAYDSTIEQVNKLPDTLDESGTVWVKTTNRTKVAPKVETPPAQVTRAQFLVQMHKAGIKADAEVIISTQDEETKLWYANALHFLYGHPRIEAINAALAQPQFSSSPVNLDQFFIDAATNAP